MNNTETEITTGGTRIRTDKRHRLTPNDRKAIFMALDAMSSAVNGTGVQVGFNKYSISREGDNYTMEKQDANGDQSTIPFTIVEPAMREVKTNTLKALPVVTNYTAPPWIMCSAEGGKKMAIETRNLGNDCLPVATLRGPDRFANARLIASAPELLSVLEGMLEWARRVTQKNPGPEIAAACNAVAKAKGGTK